MIDILFGIGLMLFALCIFAGLIVFCTRYEVGVKVVKPGDNPEGETHAPDEAKDFEAALLHYHHFHEDDPNYHRWN